MKLGCIIMAAGGSRRFGENKLLQSFCGSPLYARALNAVPAEAFFQVVTVTGYAPVAQMAEELGFTVVENRQPELGVSHTIRLGLEAAEAWDGALFMTADQPFLSRQTLRRLAAAFCAEPESIHAAAAGTTVGNPCVFPKEYFPELKALEGDTGGKAVLRCHKDRLRLHLVDEMELLDCDTPQALEICREKAAKKLEKHEKSI